MSSMDRGTGQVTFGTVGEFRLYKPKALSKVHSIRRGKS